MPRKCVNNPDSFCCICGKVTLVLQKRTITPVIKKAYHLYFCYKLGDQEQPWAPHICCISCSAGLSNWFHGKRRAMPFGVPMIWREPTDHVTNCYFCIVPSIDHGVTKKRTQSIQYPNIPSPLRPVPHGEGLPVPDPPTNIPTEFSDDNDANDNVEASEPSTSEDVTFLPTAVDDDPHQISQNEHNDLVRNLGLSKSKAELLGPRLQQWKLLQDDFRISVFRSRHSQFEPYFSMAEQVVYCHNVAGLMDELKIQYANEEWRLFIDSSKTSLKAVLLHNGITLPSVPITHAAGLKETYDNIKLVLVKIKYEEHQQICGDLEVVALILGLQLGYTKFCCFLCE